MSGREYAIRVVDDPGAVDAAAWDALAGAEPEATPFVSHAYLAALTASASAVPKTGWTPCFLLLERGGPGGELRAAAPLYAKTHSYGEYVFDWAWAHAYRQHGLEYYPKLLDAVPFTPVPGPRLLARTAEERVLLLKAMEEIARGNGFSSAHVLFLSEADRAAAVAAGWSLRTTVQFHWTNREPDPWPDWAAFLASLQREKRKKIQQERRRVAEAGVTLEARLGREIRGEDWEHFHRCYVRTYRDHGNPPYLTRDFFARMERALPESWLLFTAFREGRRVAASLLAVDPLRKIAFGRYWGATEHVPLLHFEACYYAPLDWCIAHGYRRFEGGAQGEHKMARGLMPVETHSAHWLADARFARAVDDFLAREGEGMAAYVAELDERTPFRQPPSGDRPGAA